jgi:hypothetical protein
LKTHGHARKSGVPAIGGTSPKVCRKCDSWFAARTREQVCLGCLPPWMRAKRAAQAHHSRAGGSVGKRAGYDGGKVVFSDALGLTFAAQPSDPRAASLECRVLAYEHAAKERWTKGRTPDIPQRLAA